MAATTKKKPVVITDVDDDESKVQFALPGDVILTVPRLDYIDEDAFDVINADLEALDVQQQVIAVANDVAASPVGTKLQWRPLLDDTKTLLAAAGVEVVRVVVDGERRDEVSAPDQDAVDALEEYSVQKPLPPRKRARSVALAMLKHVVDDDEYQRCSKLRVGQLEHILGEWRKRSSVSLGE